MIARHLSTWYQISGHTWDHRCDPVYTLAEVVLQVFLLVHRLLQMPLLHASCYGCCAGYLLSVQALASFAAMMVACMLTGVQAVRGLA